MDPSPEIAPDLPPNGSVQPSAQQAGPASGADWLWLVGIVALAAVLRAIFLVQFLSYPLASDLHMDMLIHHEWASAFAAGELYWDGAYFRAPLYPWFLGVIYSLFEADPMPARIAQVAMGSLSCGLIFWIGRRVFGRTTGAIAGLLAATYGTLMYFDVQLLIPVMIVFLDLILLLLLLRAGERPTPTRWILAGVALGLSAIARPNILLFAPCLVVWQIFLLRAPKRFLGHAACLTLGTLVPILPITVRNVVVGDEFSLVATQGGINWYIGNNPGSDGMTAIMPGDPPDWWRCYQAQIDRAEEDLGRELTNTEVSRYYSGKVLEFFRDDPKTAGGLLLKKLGLFWTRHEIANNQDISLVKEHYTPIAHHSPVGFWLVGPLGVLGLVLALRRARELFPLWGFVIVYMVSVVAFFVTARYRIPVVSVLIIFSASSLTWLVGCLRSRKFLQLAAALLFVVAPMGWLASRVPGTPEYVRIQGFRTLGLQAIENSDYVEAERFLSMATAATDELGAPARARSWFFLGFARQEQGNLTGARDAYERAFAIRHKYRQLRWRMAQVYRDLGDSERAEAEFKGAIERDPIHAEPRAELVQLYFDTGRVAQGLALAERNAEELPEDPIVLWSTALARRDSGTPRSALKLVRRGISIAEPNSAIGRLLRSLRSELREEL